MDSEFDLVFKNVGWENAWEINEQGSKLLTIEFLSTLELDSDEIKFRMFNKSFTITWKNLSVMLGFSNQCVLDVLDAIPDFDTDNFWESITARKPGNKLTTDEVHHPTIRFLFKWLALIFFPREELNTIRHDYCLCCML